MLTNKCCRCPAGPHTRSCLRLYCQSELRPSRRHPWRGMSRRSRSPHRSLAESPVAAATAPAAAPALKPGSGPGPELLPAPDSAWRHCPWRQALIEDVAQGAGDAPGRLGGLLPAAAPTSVLRASRGGLYSKDPNNRREAIFRVLRGRPAAGARRRARACRLGSTASGALP